MAVELIVTLGFPGWVLFAGLLVGLYAPKLARLLTRWIGRGAHD